jgi:uncharacterized cupredoxin-like copper-binding protein
MRSYDMFAKLAVTGLVSAAAFAAALAVGDWALSPPASAHGNHVFAAGEPGDPKKPFRVVEILMTDGAGRMAYAPDRLEVKKGEQIKFVLRNSGLVDHEFLIDSFENNAKHKKEMEKHADMSHHEPNAARLAPSATAQLLWRFTRSGTFEFACLIPGHYETGMKGTVVVK